jgi:hypothetical protein
MDNEEIDRFRLATAGDVSSFVARVKKTVRWRERYYFLSQADLKPWTHLVLWHHHDTLGHPTLIVRLGLAFSILTPSERPRFSQAVGMQTFHIPFYLHLHKLCCWFLFVYFWLKRFSPLMVVLLLLFHSPFAKSDCNFASNSLCKWTLQLHSWLEPKMKKLCVSARMNGKEKWGVGSSVTGGVWGAEHDQRR